jgi:hypothetical protein
MKPYDLRPFNPFGVDQIIQEFDLRPRRSEEADGAPSLGYEAAHFRDDRRGSRLEGLPAGRADTNIEFARAKIVSSRT